MTLWRLNLRISLLVPITITMFVVLSITITTAFASNTVVFPPNSKPYGLTFADHIKNFWKWSIAIPANQNPVNDATGEKCMNGQSNSNSSVVYLAFNNGGISERTCKLPAGKGLLIPLMVAEVSDKELPNASVEELTATAKKDQDSVNSLYLNIDNKEYKYENLTKYRTRTDGFDVLFPDNGLFGVTKAGPSKAVADGYYIITEPLSKGNHTVHFKSSLICSDPDCADPNYVQDVKYNLIVQ